ncbi:Transcription factor AP-2-delta [Bagarius yarrelli]|uniref:Transcription factor AP-2-delta n=1 Tax=Bagarius yarrelli TaxID=175774 RepID=A0A556TJ80_BAGYA|nr:Transcription factor AP-2-delta [Bagarius yarrelli]
MDPSSGMHMPPVPPNSDVVRVTVGNPIITMYPTPLQAPNITQLITQQVIPQEVTCQTLPHTVTSQVQIASQAQVSMHGHGQGRVQSQSLVQSQSHMSSQSHGQSQSHMQSQSHGQSQSHMQSQSHGQSQSHMQPQGHGQSQSHLQSQGHGQSQSHMQSQSHGQSQSHMQSQSHGPSQIHVQSQSHGPSQVHVPQSSQSESVSASQDGASSSLQVPFAEVASLLDPNMKSSKARKYQIHYEEVKRRLEPPEKMSLRSLAAYTRVSRGPASKKTLLESLNVFGLSPSTNTAVSSTFSKLTEGDTAALCKDMRDFALQYVDYENMAKQLLPETNQVQHWSKIIETRNYLEEMRKVFKEPVNSRLFSNVTHGLGNGVMDVALDIINTVIDRQIRILSGNTDPKPEPPVRRIRKRTRKPKAVTEDGKLKEKAKRGRKKGKQMQIDTVEPPVSQPTDIESSVLTLVSVGYETISSGLCTTSTGLQ